MIENKIYVKNKVVYRTGVWRVQVSIEYNNKKIFKKILLLKK